jgi:hypothetical protein
MGFFFVERNTLQKQSKQEADDSIAEFKATKEAEYKQMTSSIDTSDYAKVREAGGFALVFFLRVLLFSSFFLLFFFFSFFFFSSLFL